MWQDCKNQKYDDQRYYLEDAVNELCGMILLITIDLAEPEAGVQYFFKNSRDRNKEITLYRALMLANWMDEDELWIFIYEYGLEKKINPRESLRTEYMERITGSRKTCFPSDAHTV